MSDEFMGTMNEIAAEARAAGDQLEREGRAINAALKAGDTLAAFIIERALSTREGDNIAIGFDSIDAATIANQALAYQQARGGATLDARGSVA